MAYDATEAIIEGLKQSNNRAELQSVLTNPSFSVKGATETFRFQQGDRTRKVQLAYVGKPQPSSKHYQFLPLNNGDRQYRFSLQTQPTKSPR
jgi:branched-chain amino acid transport system substrate-binding protein